VRISLTLDDIIHYICNAFVVNGLTSLDVSRLFPLLPDCFRLDGHILGTNSNSSLISFLSLTLSASLNLKCLNGLTEQFTHDRLGI
jgi:hypothetical protein